MVTGNVLAQTVQSIASFYLKNQGDLEKTYVKVATQKRFVTPRQNITDYFRTQQIRVDSYGYNEIRKNVSEAAAVVDVAEKAATFVYEDIGRMRQLVDDYYKDGVDAEVQSRIESEFNQLKSQVTDTIATATYDGKQLIADTTATGPIRSVNLDPRSFSHSIDITFASSDIASTTALDITAGENAAIAAVDAELSKAGTYLGKTTGYRYGLNAQLSLSEKMLVSNTERIETISENDNAQEIQKMVRGSIQQQSSVSMMAQANMMQQGILRLIM